MMQIIIVGGGGVGAALAKLLSDEKQDVVIIEQDPDKARSLNEELDVMVNTSNGASARALEEAGVRNAEMGIAVTEVDEVNIIACLLAKKYGVHITVARVRNPEYYEGDIVLSNEQLGIDIFINPERVASFEITKLIKEPDIRDTEYFAKGRIKMFSVVVDAQSRLINQPLHKVHFPNNTMVAAIEKANGDFVIPSGDAVIQTNDKLFLIGQRGMFDELGWLLQKKEQKTQNVVILGGGRIGFQLAEMLEANKKNNINIKIIEKSSECCQFIASKLSRTLILQGDATDLSFLRQEEIQNADILVAVTGDDRTNILASVLAKHFGVKKTICEVINQDYYTLFENIGIEHIISPRILTAAQILRLIRKGDIFSFSFLEDGKMEVMELSIPGDARVANKKIQHAGIPPGILIGAILRGDKVITPRGNDYLLPDDHVIIFCSPTLNHHIDRLFASPRDSANIKNNLTNEKLYFQ